MGDDIDLNLEFYRMEGGRYPDTPDAIREIALARACCGARASGERVGEGVGLGFGGRGATETPGESDRRAVSSDS